MRCHHAHILMTRQLRERLTRKQSAALSDHLRACSACRTEQTELANFAARLQQAEPSVAPAFAVTRPRFERLEAALSGSLPPRRAARPLPRLALAGGAVTLALVLFTPFLRSVWLPAIPSHGLFGKPSVHVAPQLAENPTARLSEPRPMPSTSAGFRRHEAFLTARHPASLLESPEKRAALSAAMADTNYLNGDDPTVMLAQWSHIRSQEFSALRASIDATIRGGDDFVQVPFPRLASQDARSLAAAATVYKQEKEKIDARLACKVSLAVKGQAFSDLCSRLRQMTGIGMRAGRSVVDDKVTLFCKDQPLRDVMRQINRVFGFTWLRSGEEGAYQYELTQGIRAQLAEEELREHDRLEALLDLDRQMKDYQKNLNLSPSEAKTRAETATGAEKQLLWAHGMQGSDTMRMFSQLSAEELMALRGGQELKFSADPGPGERTLPPGIGEGLTHFPDYFRLQLSDHSTGFGPSQMFPNGQPLADFSDAQPTLRLSLQETEPGKFDLFSTVGVKLPGRAEKGLLDQASIPCVAATGLSPSVRNPKNADANAPYKSAFMRDPHRSLRVTIQPMPSCTLKTASQEVGGSAKATTADVLEAIHKVTGQSIIADYYTRLYDPAAVSVRDVPLFDALNRLCDTTRFRWKPDKDWLQFRSPGFFNDRLMEVPNRLLERWADFRRQQGALPPDDLAEIALLRDTQLHSQAVALGARAVYGLEEWEMARNRLLSDWRFFAGLSPRQRRLAATEKGLPYTQMNPDQQQGFRERCLGGGQGTPEWSAEAAFRLRYTFPRSEKEAPRQPVAADLDHDIDAKVLRESAKRAAAWKAENVAQVAFIYRYYGGRGKLLKDIYDESREYNGKVF